MTSLCTSVERTNLASVPIRMTLRVPHHGRGEAPWSQAIWRQP
jgi:hypothetical protein